MSIDFFIVFYVVMFSTGYLLGRAYRAMLNRKR